MDPHLPAFSSGSMESDLPAIDVVDHTQSELPNLDGGSFDLAGSNHGNLPDLSQPLAASAANRLQEFVDEATGVDNLSCYDFSRLPECEFASVGEFGRRHKKRTNKKKRKKRKKGRPGRCKIGKQINSLAKLAVHACASFR